MLYFCVNRTPQSANSFACRKSKESPSNFFSFYTSRAQRLNSFICRTSGKFPGRIPPQITHALKGQSRQFPPTARTLFSLLSLLSPRVFHISFAFNGFRTLSQKCRVYGVPAATKFLKCYLNSFSHLGTRLLPLPLAPPLVLSLPLCDNLGLPFQKELRLRCPVRAPGKQ
jgi:hypothetical protein